MVCKWVKKLKMDIKYFIFTLHLLCKLKIGEQFVVGLLGFKVKFIDV